MPPSFDSQRLASLVRASRQRQRLTLDQLAEKTGWSKSALWRIERGWATTLADPAKLIPLCVALQISVAEVLGAAGYLITETITNA